MTGRRKTRKQRNDETTAALIIAAAAVFAIYTAHLWGWVCVTGAIALVSYAAGSRRHKRHLAPAARRPPRLRAPRGRRRTVTLSAACAGNDHPLCRDRLCNCLCDHPHRAPRAYAGDAPLPADDVPPF